MAYLPPNQPDPRRGNNGTLQQRHQKHGGSLPTCFAGRLLRENQIVKALPKMIEKATNRELAAGLRKHLKETENQVSRLEQAFERLGQTPKGVDCPAIDGLVEEADEIAGEVEDKKVLDAAVTGSAQAVEHYEISRYG